MAFSLSKGDGAPDRHAAPSPLISAQTRIG
jgi:hypothetical protein